MPPLLADFTHARVCKPFCEKFLTLPIWMTSVSVAAGISVRDRLLVALP